MVLPSASAVSAATAAATAEGGETVVKQPFPPVVRQALKKAHVRNLPCLLILHLGLEEGLIRSMDDLRGVIQAEQHLPSGVGAWWNSWVVLPALALAVPAVVAPLILTVVNEQDTLRSDNGGRACTSTAGGGGGSSLSSCRSRCRDGGGRMTWRRDESGGHARGEGGRL